MICKPQNCLNLIQGVSIAFGSIIGAGVLFIPQNLIAIAGNGAVYSLFFGFLALFLFAFILYRIALDHTGHKGLDDIISQAFDGRLTHWMPLALVLALSLGLPVAATYGARILGSFISDDFGMVYFVSFVMLLVSFFINCMGFTKSLMTQAILVGLLCLVSILLFCIVWEQPLVSSDYASTNSQSVLDGLLISCLAFVGIENMAAISDQFSKRKMSYLLSMIIGLVLSVAIYCIFLYAFQSSVVGVLTTVEMNIIDILSLFHSSLNHIASPLVLGASLLAVMLNIVSWNIGATVLIGNVFFANKGKIEEKYMVEIIQFAMLFIYSVVLILLKLEALTVSGALAQASALFVSIYFVSLISFIKETNSKGYKLLALFLLLGLSVIVFNSVIYFILPTILVVLIVFYNIKFTSCSVKGT